MLEVSGITVRYGVREVLSNVSLRVDKGELITVIGANGAGKTTCLRTISGLLKPVQGTISFQGRSIAGRPPHELLSMGIAHVPEGRLLFPEMTVLEHLELGAVRAPADAPPYRQRLDRCFDLFPRVKERQQQRAGTLSGGEQQMVAIARGLMSSPKLLMLDEPSLGLAPVVVDTLADIFTDLHRQGLGILLVEQRVELALRLADRGYVLETGRILLEDAASSLIENPKVKQAFLGI